MRFSKITGWLTGFCEHGRHFHLHSRRFSEKSGKSRRLLGFTGMRSATHDAKAGEPVRHGMTSRRLRMLFEVGTTTGLTDGQLLERFATRSGDSAEAAFEAIVERHGSMVLRVCRSILRDEHEAMDAFQATFLILARKGRGLWVGDSLGPWLHRVARRAASKARANAVKCRAIELRAAELAMASIDSDPARDDLASILHEELDRLPERYRAAIVLCDLQGYSCEETARRLGCAVGTVGSRLSRGRERLRTRLTRRGLAPTAGLIATAMTREAIGAVVPPSLVRLTVKSVLAFSSGKATIGVSSAAVALLVEDVSRSLLMMKIRSMAAVALVACGSTLVAGGTLRAIARAQDPAETKPKTAERDNEEAFNERHKNFLKATAGNFRPLSKDGDSVNFQSREAVLYTDGTVKLYLFEVPIKKKEPIVPPLRHNDPIRDFRVFDESRLLITSSDAMVRFWDGLTGESRKTIEGQFIRPLLLVEQSDDEGFATVDVAGKVVSIWKLKTLDLTATIKLEGSPCLIGAGLSKNGKTLATVGEDHSVTLRNAIDGSPFATLRPPSPPIRLVVVESKAINSPHLQLDADFWDSVRFLIPAEYR